MVPAQNIMLRVKFSYNFIRSKQWPIYFKISFPMTSQSMPFPMKWDANISFKKSHLTNTQGLCSTCPLINKSTIKIQNFKHSTFKLSTVHWFSLNIFFCIIPNYFTLNYPWKLSITSKTLPSAETLKSQSSAFLRKAWSLWMTMSP